MKLSKLKPTVDILGITSDTNVLSPLPGVSPGQTIWPCTWRGTSEQVVASADLLSLYRDQPPGCPALIRGRSVCPAKACHFAPYPVPPGISGRKAYWAVVEKKNTKKNTQKKFKNTKWKWRGMKSRAKKKKSKEWRTLGQNDDDKKKEWMVNDGVCHVVHVVLGQLLDNQYTGTY